VERWHSHSRAETIDRFHEIKRYPENRFIATDGDNAWMRNIGLGNRRKNPRFAAHCFITFCPRGSWRTAQYEIATPLRHSEDDVLTTTAKPSDARYRATRQVLLVHPVR
jgi:hypothetical protein